MPNLSLNSSAMCLPLKLETSNGIFLRTYKFFKWQILQVSNSFYLLIIIPECFTSKMSDTFVTGKVKNRQCTIHHCYDKIKMLK